MSTNIDIYISYTSGCPDLQQPRCNIDLHPKENRLSHTGVTTFHRWKVRQSLTHMHAKDLKALQTLYSRAGCSLLKGMSSRTCPMLQNKFFQNFSVKATFLASYMPSPPSFECQTPPHSYYPCPKTHGKWGRMGQEFMTLSCHSRQ